MARLIAVCRSEDFEFERRQIGLTIDDTLTMVIQFSDTCIDCEHICGVKQKELERFIQRFNILSKDEIAVAMMVTSKEIFNLLAQLVPCVGCRRSVERLFNQLVKSGHPALEPLVITSSGVLSINRNYLFDPRAMYALFYVHGAKLTSVMDSIPKSKKNKRCNLHSLDTHKTKTTGSWMDIWEILSQDCKEEVVLIDADSLMDTLETYLRKHRFCSECKAKVMRAYSILVGDLDSTEKGYCPALYEGLRYCPQEQHIHLLCDSDFIAHLIGRAEPELAGSRRDRHAKTLDIAQEEVLTCLGIHIYERLNRIWQKLRAEEQTWQIMFYLGVDALKKSYEVALERKQGVSNLELMCEELEEEERVKEMKREQKRQKKKKKRAKQNLPELETCIENMKPDNVSCKCDSLSDNVSPKKNGFHSVRREDPNSNTKVVSAQSCGYMRGRWLGKGSGSLVFGSRCSDAGYSSGAEGCDSCSMPSSNDGSDVAYSDSTCSHDGGENSCSQEKVCSCSCKGSMSSACKSSSSPSCPQPGLGQSRHIMHDRGSSPVISNGGLSGGGHHGMTLSLQDMLEQSCSSEDEDDFISEEEIQRFKANQNLLLRKRQELRETLRQRFDNMQQRSTDSPSASRHKELDQLTRELLNM